MGGNKKLLVILEVAIIAAFAMALEYLPHQTGVSSVQFSYGLIPIGVLALRRGLWPGLAAGLTWGLLDLILRGLADGEVLNFWQGFLEYPIAFTAAGLMGVMYPLFHSALKRNKTGQAVSYAIGAIVIGTVAKYFCHFIAGVVFWGSYAPKGMNAWLYSLVINGLSAVFSGLLAIVVISALVTIAKHLFLPKPVATLKQA